jgi:DNA polymerase II small subunit/DNA polymerase delta subunit B
MEAEAEPLRVADNLLSQFARSVCLDVMPGPDDPSNVALPQQPLHQCMFPRSAGYRDGFQLVTNPYKCEIGGTVFLGHSGQPVSDIARYSHIGLNNDEDGLDLTILESTLKWQHLAPTAPDTLPCFPFKQRDPLVISGKVPDVLFTGSAAKFSTKIVTMDNGHAVSILLLKFRNLLFFFFFDSKKLTHLLHAYFFSFFGCM